MNVAVIASSAPSLVNFRGELLKEMVRRGHRVYALAPSASPRVRDTESALRKFGVQFVAYSLSRRGLSPLEDFSSLLELERILRALRVECILSYTAKPVIYGSLAAHRAGIQEIYSMITGLGFAFSSDTFSARIIRGISKTLYRRSLQYNRRVFFQNPDDLQLFVEANILQSGEQGVLINGSGVDLERFAIQPFPAEISFLLIARLIAEKGIREYVAAARRVKSKYPNIQFRLVGSFETGASKISKQEIDRWTDEGVIEYLGTLPDVRPALRNCSVFVLPTYYREGQPRTILEAMATGRPIITTDNPGSRETVVNGLNGFLVKPRDVDDLYKAMVRFIENPKLIPRMGASSRTIAEEKYDVHRINQVILAFMGL